MPEWASWDSSGKSSWSYWGTKKKPKGGKGADPKKTPTKKGKGKSDVEGNNDKFLPSYDSIPLASMPSSSASGSQGDSLMWQKALFDLVSTNPQLKMPDALKSQIQSLAPKMEDGEKEKLYQQQKLINAKRKAYQKLERLELALKRKKFQMVSYQEEIKKQLALEMQRFQKETVEIEQSIKDTQDLCARLESGDLPEQDMSSNTFVDAQEDLATMLGLTGGNRSTDDQAKLIEQLQQEKRHLEAAAMQWKSHAEALFAGQCAPWMHSPSGMHMMSGPSKVDSPQLPEVALGQDRQDHKRRKIGADGVEVITDSPLGGGMD